MQLLPRTEKHATAAAHGKTCNRFQGQENMQQLKKLRRRHINFALDWLNKESKFICEIGK